MAQKRQHPQKGEPAMFDHTPTPAGQPHARPLQKPPQVLPQPRQPHQQQTPRRPPCRRARSRFLVHPITALSPKPPPILLPQPLQGKRKAMPHKGIAPPPLLLSAPLPIPPRRPPRHADTPVLAAAHRVGMESRTFPPPQRRQPFLLPLQRRRHTAGHIRLLLQRAQHFHPIEAAIHIQAAPLPAQLLKPL